LIKLLAGTLRSLVFIKDLMPSLVSATSKPLAKFGRFFLLTLILPIYKRYTIIKKLTAKFYAPQKSRHRLLHPLSRRWLIHALVWFIVFFVISFNVDASEVKRDDLGQNSIIGSLVDEDLGTIEVEGPVSSARRVTRYVGQTGIASETSRDDGYEQNIFPTTAAGGSAIVSPILSPAEETVRQRDTIITYTVQPGDTASQIAEQFGISVNTLLWENNLTSYQLIRQGDKLIILPTSGLRHKVERGDTVASIAKKYESDPDRIIEFNKLASANDINVGESLIIPGGVRPAPTPVARPTITRPTTIARPSTPGAPVVTGSGKMTWPTSCQRITQYFQFRHSGLDIACPFGQPIYAADAGTVSRAQSGWNGGYGTMIIVDHGNGTQTLYGHLSALYVKVGDKVAKGENMGAMGSTGRSTGSHVHFEVIVGGVKRNPISYIR
jgi:murein DD-endopeptidase MepM/ murein hydrolase activator NlpD